MGFEDSKWMGKAQVGQAWIGVHWYPVSVTTFMNENLSFSYSYIPSESHYLKNKQIKTKQEHKTPAHDRHLREIRDSGDQNQTMLSPFHTNHSTTHLFISIKQATNCTGTYDCTWGDSSCMDLWSAHLSKKKQLHKIGLQTADTRQLLLKGQAAIPSYFDVLNLGCW